MVATRAVVLGQTVLLVLLVLLVLGGATGTTLPSAQAVGERIGQADLADLRVDSPLNPPEIADPSRATLG